MYMSIQYLLSCLVSDYLSSASAITEVRYTRYIFLILSLIDSQVPNTWLYFFFLNLNKVYQIINCLLFSLTRELPTGDLDKCQVSTIYVIFIEKNDSFKKNIEKIDQPGKNRFLRNSTLLSFEKKKSKL